MLSTFHVDRPRGDSDDGSTGVDGYVNRMCESGQAAGWGLKRAEVIGPARVQARMSDLDPVHLDVDARWARRGHDTTLDLDCGACHFLGLARRDVSSARATCR